MRREVAPVVEPGEPEDVLGRRDQADGEPEIRHPAAHRSQPRSVFLVVDGEVAPARVRDGGAGVRSHRRTRRGTSPRPVA